LKSASSKGLFKNASLEGFYLRINLKSCLSYLFEKLIFEKRWLWKPIK